MSELVGRPFKGEGEVGAPAGDRGADGADDGGLMVGVGEAHKRCSSHIRASAFSRHWGTQNQ